MLHYNGLGWERLPPLTTADLSGLWASGPDDVWATGTGGVLLHQDGRGWRTVDSGTSRYLAAVWGSGPRDIWAAGGVLTHYDGERWSVVGDEVITAGLSSIWGTGPDDVWIVAHVFRHEGAVPPPGAAGIHWNGQRWALYFPGIDHHDAALVVSGSRRDDVWVGAGGESDTPPRLLRYDGRIWKSFALPTEQTAYVLGLWGSGPSDHWAATGSLENPEQVFHFDGERWSASEMAPGGGQLSLDGLGPADVWLVGGDSRIAHFDGAAWTRHDRNALVPTEYPVLAGSGPTDVWAGSTFWNRLSHYDGTSWSMMAAPPAKPPRPDSSARLWDLWSPGPGELWAVYDTGLFHLQQGTWSEVETGFSTSLRAIWGAGGGDIWITGAGGLALHGDGRVFSPADTGTRDELIAVAGSAADFVEAISAAGTLVHWDGARWMSHSGPDGAGELRHIAVFDNRRWVAAEHGLFSVRDLARIPDGGLRWSQERVSDPRGGGFSRVMAFGLFDAWTVTDRGGLYHYGDSGWERSDTGCTTCVSGFWGVGEDLWVTGHWGSILHLRR